VSLWKAVKGNRLSSLIALLVPKKPERHHDNELKWRNVSRECLQGNCLGCAILCQRKCDFRVSLDVTQGANLLLNYQLRKIGEGLQSLDRLRPNIQRDWERFKSPDSLRRFSLRYPDQSRLFSDQNSPICESVMVQFGSLILSQPSLQPNTLEDIRVHWMTAWFLSFNFWALWANMSSGDKFPMRESQAFLSFSQMGNTSEFSLNWPH